jgi:rhamnosyltransferase subunit B
MPTRKILISTWGSLGDLFPYLALAGELARRGHQVAICTTPYHQQRIEEAGFQFYSSAPHLNFESTELRRAIMEDRRSGQLLLRDILLAQVRQSYADLLEATRGAELLITQMVAYAGPILAAKTGIPWISTMLAPTGFFSYHDSPVLAPELRGLRERAPAIHAMVNRAARWTTRHWGDPVRQLRVELGLDRGGDPVFEGQHSPTRVLALFSRELAEPQPDWPRNTVVTGFLFNDEPPLPPAVEQFLRAGDPPIVFTLGSSAVHAPGRFYEESLEAARRLGRRAILLGGPAVSDTGILGIEYAPHGRLFREAAAIIHQGGIGTTGRAMSAGRPMLVVPWAYDQPDNAARLVRKGTALTIGRRSYNAGRAMDALEELLTNPSYRRNAEATAARLNAENGLQVAADSVTQTLATL